MTQSRLSSFYEAVMSTALGFFISMLASAVVYPLHGHAFTFAQNASITAIFTALSIARSYVVRRYFNARLRTAAQRMAGEL